MLLHKQQHTQKKAASPAKTTTKSKTRQHTEPQKENDVNDVLLGQQGCLAECCLTHSLCQALPLQGRDVHGTAELPCTRGSLPFTSAW